MTGEDLKLSGTRQDFDTDRRADRPDGVHRQGRGQVPRRSPRSIAQQRPAASSSQGRGEVLDQHSRSSSTARSSRAPTDRLRRVPGRHPGRQRRPDHGHRRRRRGEGPGARPPDRCAADRVRAGRSHPDLGDARQGLAERGAGRRSPACWSSRSSCSSPTASSASSPCSGSASTRPSSTRRSSSSTSR